MKLTMKSWSELDAIAWFMEAPVCRRRGVVAKRRSTPERIQLEDNGLIRFISTNRLRITRDGRAALASKSRRFLDRAERIAMRAHRNGYGGDEMVA